MQHELQVKIKRLHPDSVIPTYAKDGDAGMDLVATTKSKAVNTGKAYNEYGTGLSVEIPVGYVGLIFPRSSISNAPFTLSNCVGVVDSGYRGEIKLRFTTTGNAAFLVSDQLKSITYEEVYGELADGYNVGDKIGQLIIMPYPRIVFTEVQDLAGTERGEGGFGSTGTK
jgi:dUTP pyrophosphatase